ncbi:MAG: pyridoxal-phosphate dependent enzyme [Candidatus Heimdallarchaeota archaeon]|nr:pyridoxal-phosphate dependent enzyme [Candidatus Heimdallarchaeota archaeon]
MFEKVEAAYRRIKKYVNHTPVMTSSTLDRLLDCRCFFKCENFQKIGAFKFRGAMNTLLQLSQEERRKGVITHSSGNHAQALALAANVLGVQAVIVMPENAPKVKMAATKGYGAKIVVCGSKPGDREEAVKPLIAKHGYTFIHPSDDLRIIHGAGTAAYELIEDVGSLDFIFVPVGGGGLLSGTAIATKGLLPNCKVIAAEPANADDAYRTFKTGKLHPSVNPQTIADGLRTQLGPNTFQIVMKLVDDIVTVTEEQIIDAMQFLWERMKLVVEPSGAVSLAGVLSKKVSIKGKKVGIVISGGNVDLTSFFAILRTKVAAMDSKLKAEKLRE